MIITNEMIVNDFENVANKCYHENIEIELANDDFYADIISFHGPFDYEFSIVVNRPINSAISLDAHYIRNSKYCGKVEMLIHNENDYKLFIELATKFFEHQVFH